MAKPIKILLEKDKNGKPIAFKIIKGRKVRMTMPDYKAALKEQRSSARAAKPPKKVAPKKDKKKAAKKVTAKAKPAASSRVSSTKDKRRVSQRPKTATRVRGLRATVKGLGKTVLAHEASAASVGKFGGKIGAGIGGGIAGLILAAMMGGSDKAKQPELPMGLMQLAGQAGGDNTSKTLQDVARLVSILKGAQGLAGSIAPPPMQAVRNSNPFSAAGLVA